MLLKPLSNNGKPLILLLWRNVVLSNYSNTALGTKKLPSIDIRYLGVFIYILSNTFSTQTFSVLITTIKEPPHSLDGNAAADIVSFQRVTLRNSGTTVSTE